MHTEAGAQTGKTHKVKYMANTVSQATNGIHAVTANQRMGVCLLFSGLLWNMNDRSIDSAKALLITVAPLRSVRSITMNSWIGAGEGRTQSSIFMIYFVFLADRWKDREQSTTNRISQDHAVRITPLDSKPQSSKPDETNAKPSIVGINSSLGRSIFVKRLVYVRRLESRSSLLYYFCCRWMNRD